MEIKLNMEQKLYVIVHDDKTVSCLGFDVAYWRACEIYRWCGHAGGTAPDPINIGTPAGYADYAAMLKYGQLYHDATGRTMIEWDEGTPDRIKELLTHLVHTQECVRLFLGDHVTGRDWCEEYDVIGTVSRSMGWCKVHILLENKHSWGGSAILTGSIVRMLIDGREVYRHPTYHAPAYHIWQPQVRDGDAPQPEGLPVRVDRAWKDGDGALGPWENAANFQTWAKASRWIDFMNGKRMSK